MKKAVQRGFIAEWSVTAILLLFGSTTILQAFVIPTGSMEGTLLVGDHLLVDKLVYSPHDGTASRLLPYRDVQRGDVIVFRYPVDLQKTLVKRAIGVPGDRLRLHDKRLILNGRPVDEPYAVHIAGNSDAYRDEFPAAPAPPGLRPGAEAMLTASVAGNELVVPEGFIFAMGDNRENSDDSRYWGFVPRENIVGTPVLIYWSYDATTEDLTDPGIGLAHLFDISTHFFSKTRWSRSMNLVRAYPLQR